MRSSKVAVRYANSLLETAVENKNLDGVAADMQLVVSTLDSNPLLVKVLMNPVIKSGKKIAILKDIFESRVGKDSMNFLVFVVNKSREDILREILTKFLRLRDDHLGIIKVNVTTAFEFSDEQQKMLREKLESVLKKKIEFIFNVNPGIIGGFVAQVDDVVFDASLKHQLELIKKQFLSGSPSLN